MLLSFCGSQLSYISFLSRSKKTTSAPLLEGPIKLTAKNAKLTKAVDGATWVTLSFAILNFRIFRFFRGQKNYSCTAAGEPDKVDREKREINESSGRCNLGNPAFLRFLPFVYFVSFAVKKNYFCTAAGRPDKVDREIREINENNDGINSVLLSFCGSQLSHISFLSRSKKLLLHRCWRTR